MENRKYALIFLFLLITIGSRAQTFNSFEQADSVSNAQYLAGNWAQLIITGKAAIKDGHDSPALRERLGYAQMLTEDYSEAIKEYEAVLKKDPQNTTARYYAYLCNQYLNQDAGASYHAGYLDTSQRKGERLSPFAFINAGVENSIKFNDNAYRSAANYSRVYLSNQLSWRWQLSQSVAYFKQDFYNTPVFNPASQLYINQNSTNTQIEYYGKLGYSLSGSLQLVGMYHYLKSSFLDASYFNHIGTAGLRYSGSHIAFQGDVNMGVMIGQHLNQYSGSIIYYPNGNLNFYTVSRASYLQRGGSSNVVFAQSVGYKLTNTLWAETAATFGNQNNYIDADALYIYNGIDPIKLKLGQTFFYQLGRHAQLQLNYTYENKQDDIHSLTYNQHAITAGLSWKF